MSSASGREDSLSQDSHVLFMTLPLMDMTVNESLVQYTSLFQPLQKVNMMLLHVLWSVKFYSGNYNWKNSDIWKSRRPLSLVSALSDVETHFGVGIMDLNGGEWPKRQRAHLHSLLCPVSHRAPWKWTGAALHLSSPNLSQNSLILKLGSEQLNVYCKLGFLRMILSGRFMLCIFTV